MAGIEFERSESNLTILNPFKDFSEEVHRVEVRKDPLLGHASVYNPYLREKVKYFFRDCDERLVSALVKETAETCFFCTERLERSTPRYPPDLIPEGRLRRGAAVLFPNLYPLGKYHSVVVLVKEHFLKLSEFTPLILENGLQLAQQFVHLVYSKDSAASFVAVNANYLFPAGASLVHPHLQMLITPVPYSHHEGLIDASESYYKGNGTSYHLDLIAQEKSAGQRYVAQKGSWHWLAAFSPMGMNEIIALHERVSDFGLLAESDLSALAYGISRVLSFYESLGHLSFNYSILSVRDPLSRESFRCLLRVINRQNVYPNYRNDDYFLQKLLHADFIITPPEELASQLKQYF